MAIMHVTVKNGVKGNGSAHAQYIEREGKYSNRDDKLLSESGNMPTWAKGKPFEFWKAADKYERGASKGEEGLKGRTYKELEISLPRELSREQQIELVREFTKNVLGDKHAYTWAIHEPNARDGETNPQVHLMFSERTNDGIERNSDQYFKRYNRENPEKGGAGKDRSFTHRSFVHEVRREWAATCNEKLKQCGLNIRIDHRSYKDMGIDLLSQNQKRDFSNKNNIESVSVFELSGDIRNKQRENGERIIENPKIALDALSSMQSTFSKTDLEKFIFTRTDGAEQFVEAYNAVIGFPELERLDDKNQIFTTKTIRDVESRLVDDVKALGEVYAKHSLRIEKMPERYASFNNEQRNAFNLMVSDERIAIVNGGAGTGKSYFLHSVNEVYSKGGYKVIGAALQGSTVQDMERSTGISSRTVASLVMRLDKEKSGEIEGKSLDDKTVLIVDEAGMIGSRDMQKLMEHVKDSGATIRMVGDKYQLSAVSAGRALESVQNSLSGKNQCELIEVSRQKKDNHREASTLMSRHDMIGGLSIYESEKSITSLETQDGARAYVVAKWADDNSTNKLMLAFTNADTQAMNANARSILRERGVLGEDVHASLYKGKNNLAIGDDIIFKKPSKDLGVVNGTRGRISNINARDGEAKSISVTTDTGKQIQFDLDDYNSITHGYATTIHASQGMTVDNSYVLMSNSMNANLSYVALTRHRQNVEIAYSKEQFTDTEQLKRCVSKADDKTFSLDFDVMQNRKENQDKILTRETLAEKFGDRNQALEENKAQLPNEKWASKIPPGTMMQYDPFSDDPLVEAQRKNPRNVQMTDAQARFKAEAEARRIEEEKRREQQRQNQHGMRR